MKLIIALTLALLSTITGAAELTQDEKAFSVALRPFYDDALARGRTLIVQVVTDDMPQGSPVTAVLHPDHCAVRLTLRQNAPFSTMLGMVSSPEERRTMMRLIAAHEYGHCLAWWNGEMKEGSEGEAVSDLYALAWIANNEPRRFRFALKFMMELRQRAEVHDTSHSTLRWVTQFDPDRYPMGGEYRAAVAAIKE